MNIQLYNNLSDENVVNKILQPIGQTITTKFLSTENTNEIMFECRYFENWQEVNYIYVEDFNRFYFVNNISHDNHPLITFTANVDVLMSFRNEILNSTQIVTRSKNKHNVYYVDGDVNLIGKNIVQCKRFSGSEINSGAINSNSVNIIVTVVQK